MRVPESEADRNSGGALGRSVAAAVRARLPEVAERTVAAVTMEVPEYAGALHGEMATNISGAVHQALLGFLKVSSAPLADASLPGEPLPGAPLAVVLDDAYALGRGEARSGRSMDALLAAYRVGARVAWRELAAAAAAAGMQVIEMADFADLMFAYIDELSAASLAGHTDELARTGRVREHYLERLGRHLLAGATSTVLVAAAERANWPTPGTLTALLLPIDHVRVLAPGLPTGTLRLREDLPDWEDVAETVMLLVPDLTGPGRAHLLQVLAGRAAVLGPARPWQQVRSSYLRVLRAKQLAVGILGGLAGPLDTEEHLVELVVGTDLEALADLRTRALAPLCALPPATAERLAETLRSWLLHQGRREEVAADLFVHAQTVRYRMSQVRELFGDRLQDPRAVLELTIALALPPA